MVIKLISIKSKREIKLLRMAGKLTYETHQHLKQYIKPGITTLELNEIAEKFIEDNKVTSSFLNYEGYPKSVCTSVNEEVVHGIPNSRKLQKGDIISIDIGICYEGYHGDSAWTYSVGDISTEKQYLLEHTKKSLFEGLKEVKPGNRIGDIGNAIENYATAHKLGVVKELVGHGVGSNIHEEPDIPNYGKKGTGPIIKEGMVFAIEPMLNLGTSKIFLLDDDWTIITQDNKPSAHFEHTVLVTKDGYEILTGDDSNG